MLMILTLATARLEQWGGGDTGTSVSKSYTLIPYGRGVGPGDGKEVLNLLFSVQSSKLILRLSEIVFWLAN
jgi:hypothetical protein